jgi:surface protein
MHSLFSGNKTFNTDISMWDVSNVTDMTGMFANSIYNQPLNNWNVSKVGSMNSMFHSNYYFNQPLNNWNVSNVVSMSSMFEKCSAFNGDISNWNVGKVTIFHSMFNMWRVSPIFNIDLSNWDVHSCTNFGSMFYYCNSFNKSYISHWNVSPSSYIDLMFGNTPSYSYFTAPYPPIVPASITPSTPNTLPPYRPPTIPTNYKFYNTSDLYTAVNSYYQSNMEASLNTYGIVNTWDVSSITNMNSLFTSNGSFNYDIFNWNVSNVTDMGSMFQSTRTKYGQVVVIFNRSLANWNVVNVTNMSYMFASTQTLGSPIINTIITPAGINIGGWNVSNCLNFSHMFFQTTNFTSIAAAGLSNWQVLPLSDSNGQVSSSGSNITNMIAGTPAFSSFNIITNSLQLTSGWNTIGFFNNIIITDTNSIIQPNSIYSFDNNKFTSPVNINSIIGGKSYYIKSKSNNSISYKKTSSVPSNLINLTVGLNFIVVPTTFIYVDTSNIIISIVPSVTSNTLVQNTGYWIKAKTSGTITKV